MRIPRIVVDEQLQADTSAPKHAIKIRGASAHHLAHVLRRTVDELVEIIQKDSGATYRGRISKIDSHEIEISDITQISGLPPAPITLLCAITKPKTMDIVVEKCSEIGISQITFFHAKRSQGHYSQTKEVDRLERLYRVRDSAIKQSGAQDPPLKITFNADIKSAIEQCPQKKHNHHEFRIVCTGQTKDGQQPDEITKFARIFIKDSEISHENHNKHKISNLDLQFTQKHAEFYIIIGPEGGLTNEELEVAESYSYEPTSLGPKMLRVETAVILACGFLRFFTTQNS